MICNLKTLGLAAIAAGIGLTAMFPTLMNAEVKVSDNKSLLLTNEQGTLEITPLNDNIFRVRRWNAGRPGNFIESQSAILESGPNTLKATETPNGLEFQLPEGKLAVNGKTGKITLYSNDGKVVFSEAEGIDNSNPELKRVTFLNPGGQNFYGAGERGHSLRLNGDSLTMYNRQNYGYGKGDPRISQMGISVPYFTSDAGYGVLFDDHARGLLVLGNDTITYSSATPLDLGYYLMVGDLESPALRKQTELYTSLTGRQPLPPLWALGYITSKYGYKTREEAEGVIDRLKSSGYPVDGMVLDLYWYGVEQDMGRLEWNPEQWPGHADMLKGLQDKGVNMVLISQPYINKGGAIDNYNLLSEAGMLVKDSVGNTHDVTTWVGDAGMFDVSNPATRQWLWNRLKGLTAEGVAGWWGDLGEPEVHPETMVHDNGMTAEQFHNAYGNYWSQLIYDGLRKDFPEQRPLLMMRGGTAGLQRYGVFPWTTDVSRSWAGLQPQIALMLSSGLSGLGYMGSDVGGFAVDPEHPTDPELYVRWLQMGTFSPMLRTHAQEQPEPFNYPEMEPISKRFIKMRYEWLPYNYTLAYENATTGAPLARPLNFDKVSADDMSAYLNEQTEYLWGDDVLVAPVMEQGARGRDVFFPAGEWVSWNNPALRFEGGKTAYVQASLEELPLFVRAGSIIPQYTREIENVTQYDTQYLTLKYFPGNMKSEAVVFDDNHLSPTSLEEKAYQLTRIEAIPGAKSVEFKLTSEGRFVGMPATKQITLVIEDREKAPSSVTVNGKKLGKSDWKYDSKAKTLTVNFSWNYSPMSVLIK